VGAQGTGLEVRSVAQLTTEQRRSGQMSVCFWALSAPAACKLRVGGRVARLDDMGRIVPEASRSR